MSRQSWRPVDLHQVYKKPRLKHVIRPGLSLLFLYVKRMKKNRQVMYRLDMMSIPTVCILYHATYNESDQFSAGLTITAHAYYRCKKSSKHTNISTEIFSLLYK